MRYSGNSFWRFILSKKEIFLTIQNFGLGGHFAVIRGSSLRGHPKPWNNRPVQNWRPLKSLNNPSHDPVQKIWTGRLFHGFECPFRDKPRITAKWPPCSKIRIVTNFSFIERINLQKEFPEYLIPEKSSIRTDLKKSWSLFWMRNPSSWFSIVWSSKYFSMTIFYAISILPLINRIFAAELYSLYQYIEL